MKGKKTRLLLTYSAMRFGDPGETPCHYSQLLSYFEQLL
jgi:hypothetical protein